MRADWYGPSGRTRTVERVEFVGTDDELARARADAIRAQVRGVFKSPHVRLHQRHISIGGGRAQFWVVLVTVPTAELGK